MLNGEGYRQSFWLSVGLHTAIVVFLIISMYQASGMVRLSASAPLPSSHQAPVPVVHAQTVSAAQVQRDIQQIHAREQAVIAEQKRREVAAAQARALAIKQKAAAEAAKAKAIAMEKARAKQAKLKALDDQLKAIQQQQHAKQLAQEQQRLKAAQQQAQNQGVIDQYRSQIAKMIGQYWLVSRDVDKALRCQFLIRLAPGGVVLDVVLQQGSGNAAFDRSAQTAIYKASPLPVPKDSALFDQFREFSLVVSPKTVMLRSAAT